MNYLKASLLLIACALLAGCNMSARSISDSGYPERPAAFGPPRVGMGAGAGYQGELSEFDVLGVAPGESATDSEIRQALDHAKPIRLPRDSSVLLIQSGAMFPDGAMVASLATNSFRVAPFSGVPPWRRHPYDSAAGTDDPESYFQSLRLAAARGGSDIILCYWGILESATEDLATKTVSWVPVVNWLVPDEKQHMRIRLKIAIIDVRSGNWSVLSPPPFEDTRISTSPRRGVVDQKQVELLKARAYAAGVAALVHQFTDIAAD